MTAEFSIPQFGGRGAKRVLLRQALGGDEFLRVTWHERNGVLVFSQWERDTCVAAIPVRIEELGELATLIVTALGQRVARDTTEWAPPSPATLVADLAAPA